MTDNERYKLLFIAATQNCDETIESFDRMWRNGQQKEIISEAAYNLGFEGEILPEDLVRLAEFYNEGKVGSVFSEHRAGLEDGGHAESSADQEYRFQQAMQGNY
jgi:hypothetical protein